MTQAAQSQESKVSPARLRCIGCGAEVETAPVDFRCAQCGDLFEAFYPAWQQAPGLLAKPEDCKRAWQDRKLSLKAADRSGVWRFRELLPIFDEIEDIVTLAEGNTPIYELPRLAAKLGIGRTIAKHQGQNPTGSFKDTGMTAAISVAKKTGYEWVGCASTGNTSASMAAYAARAGMMSLVLIPEGKIAWGKLSQSLEYGAVTCQLRTDFDGCLRILHSLVRRAPVSLLNSVNPYRLEGQKTAGVELLEQLGWQVPDHVVLPGGNLGNSSAVGKMFLELRELGFISKLPKISIVQAEGANPLWRSWNENKGNEITPVVAETRATAIRIGSPASWKKAVSVLRKTGGYCEQVSDEEIGLAKAELGAEGIGCEPASAVTLAGLKKLVAKKLVASNETVVLILTGHLLKDAEFTINFHNNDLFQGSSALDRLRNAPELVDATDDAVLRVLEQRSGVRP